MKKKLYLFLALLLPAILFVFLKYAGRNKFDIPIYYEKGVEGALSDCLTAYPTPYVVPDTLWRGWGVAQREANVLVFPKSGLDFSRLKSRIEDEFGSEEVGMVALCGTGTLPVDCQKLKKCVLLINDPWESVLIDQKGQIRGYYDLMIREEEDRLRVEMKILLEKY